jgi:diguanylate cyclase (GGDEF)-like protein/PAS domain S-box-containing protein
MSYSLDTIRLLMAHDSQDKAEQLINLLRNAGRASRAELVLNENDLLHALKSGSWELFLCRPKFGNCDYTTALSHIKRLGKSPCTLILADNLDADEMCTMLEAGAQGVIPQENRDLLLLMTAQQLETVHLRRSLQQSEMALNEAEKRLSVLMDQSRDAIAYVVDGMHIHANDTYLELFGYESVDDLAGVPIMDMVSSGDHENLKKLLRTRAQDESKTHEIKCKGRDQDGKEFDATFVFSPSTFDGETCTQIVIRIESTGVDEDTLRQLAQTDSTTGLPNRSWLMSELDQRLAKAMNQGEASSILYLRVDHFEQFQSQLGIEGADALLKKLADALKAHVKGAPLARISGEEFALIAPMADPDEAAKYAEELRVFVEKLMPEVATRTLKITASIGVAFLREDSRNSQAVLTKALECCNKARTQSKDGANTVLVHNPLDDMKAGSPEAIALSLKQALEQNSLQLQFQGIMNLENEQDHFFEVFVKLPQSDGSVLAPSQFMPVAGERGLASRVDRWVALTAMKQATALKDKVRLLINISGHSLQDKELAPWLVKAIHAAKLTPKQITFQINEGDANTFLKQVIQFAATVNEAGCQFAISRFGGAINPFKLLEDVPAQLLKFEGSFTEELTNKEQRDKFAQMIQRAHAGHKEVLVGFVETAEQMQQLWTLGGINYLQGFYLSQPEEALAIHADEDA